MSVFCLPNSDNPTKKNPYLPLTEPGADLNRAGSPTLSRAPSTQPIHPLHWLHRPPRPALNPYYTTFTKKIQRGNNPHPYFIYIYIYKKKYKLKALQKRVRKNKNFIKKHPPPLLFYSIFSVA